MDKIMLVSLFLILSGCITTANIQNIVTKEMVKDEIRNVDEKNYTLGNVLKKFTGQKMVVRKAYKVSDRIEKVNLDYIIANNDFKLSGGIPPAHINLTGIKGQKYKIVGRNSHGNIAIRTNTSLLFSIDENGLWDNTISSLNAMTAPFGSGSLYSITPKNTTFSRGNRLNKKIIPLSDFGYINHELVYLGISKGEMKILYREYTFKDLLRESFSQEFFFPSDIKNINIRGYSIEIIEANYSEVVYVVQKNI